MKTKTFGLFAVTVVAAVSAFLGFTGCAEMESANTTSLLSAAGFRSETPETAKQKELYASLPAYKVERAEVKGRVFYVFKDEKNGIAYIGHEPEYQRYRQLAVQQRIAQDQYMAATMDRHYAYRWYGGWGPSRIWW